MIIFTIFDKKKKKQFAKVFESPYFANMYRNRVDHSTRFEILKVVYDIV